MIFIVYIILHAGERNKRPDGHRANPGGGSPMGYLSLCSCTSSLQYSNLLQDCLDAHCFQTHFSPHPLQFLCP